MKKLPVQPGDVFAVPVEIQAGRQGHVLGRVISEESMAHLVEIFDTVLEDVPQKVAASMLKNRLFRPVFLKFLFTKIPKWRIVQSNPAFDRKEAGYDHIRIAFDASLPPQIWEKGKTRVAKPGEIDGVEPSIVWFPEKITKRIGAHLRGELGPNDLYPV